MTALVTDSGRKTPSRLAGSAILAMQSDERLVKLVRSGHERAFDVIVDRYRKPLVRYCRRILPESRCEDAVQQAFLNAHTALTGSDDAVQLKPWLFAIARNAALNMLRQNGWNYEQIPLDFDGVRQPDQVFEQRIELEQTVAALRGLPERQRDALVMREFEGRSYDEIALALGTGDGAVRQLLNRARLTLRSAASALIPSTLVERAASVAGGDGGGVAQIVGGLGVAGVAKAGATALIAGSLVIGVANAPLPAGGSHKTTREKATLTTGEPNAAARSSDDRTIDLRGQGSPAPGPGTGSSDGRGSDSNPYGSSRHDASGRSGSDEGGRSRGDTHSGSGSGSGSGSDDSRSGSGSSGSGGETQGSGDRSGTSGGRGSDDAVATVVRSDDVGGSSGSSGSGSGSSGSGSGSGDIASAGEPAPANSSSGSSGSGSSGSGSSDSSSSSGSGSSGTASSGTASSGSGSSSSDGLDH